MKIYLIRHGQTTGDVEERYGGAYDDDLTNKGKLQSRDLAIKLVNSGIQILFSSPLKRARQTAEIIKNKLGCEIKTIDDLRERDKNGILTGMTKSEALAKYSKLVEELKDYRNTIKGAESQEDFVKRIKKVFLEITNSDYSVVGIVTHGGPIMAVFSDILNNDQLIKISDCGYAILNNKDGKLSLEKFDGIEYKQE